MATKKGKSVTDWENAADSSTPTVFYRTLNVEGLEIFYREAGPRDAPTVLLLHGFPSSSHMFRNLIPMLADKYHVVRRILCASASAAARPYLCRPRRDEWGLLLVGEGGRGTVIMDSLACC